MRRLVLTTLGVTLASAACPLLGPDKPCIDAVFIVWDGYEFGSSEISNAVTLEIGDSMRYRAAAVCHDGSQGFVDLSAYDSLVSWALTKNLAWEPWKTGHAVAVRLSPPDVVRGLLSPWYVAIGAGEAEVEMFWDGPDPSHFHGTALVNVVDSAAAMRAARRR